MKSKIKEWKILDLYKRRDQILFPVYQRGNVWYDDKRSTLIDSIMRGIDVPKLYLQKTKNGWDCIDGNQRINAIVGFIEGEFLYQGDTFNKMSEIDQQTFEDYLLTITEVTNIDDEEVRLLFSRLQLGVPLNSGEKLNAISSNLGEFVKIMAAHDFMKKIGVPARRFARQQICAQICNNSLIFNKSVNFKNSKYEDLEVLYGTNKNFNIQSRDAASIINVLSVLYEIFGNDSINFRSRAAIVTLYLHVEEMIEHDELEGNEDALKDFYLDFLSEITKQVRLGIDATNRFLISYQNKVIQGADARSSIEFRHFAVKKAFEYYLKHKKIMTTYKA